MYRQDGHAARLTFVPTCSGVGFQPLVKRVSWVEAISHFAKCEIPRLSRFHILRNTCRLLVNCALARK